MKPYQQISINECGEPLVPIPPEHFAFEMPHPYQKLGAPYHNSKADSPYYLRQGVVDSLIAAQTELQKNHQNWKILIFDAYRPVEVQQFMVDYTFNQIALAQGCRISSFRRQTPSNYRTRISILGSTEPRSRDASPSQSTGAALDITLADQNHLPIDMGSPIDEISERSYPDYFANSNYPQEQQYNHYRQILKNVMINAGFQQHPNEWWHFCLGDQMWAWLTNQNNSVNQFVARYGRY